MWYVLCRQAMYPFQQRIVEYKYTQSTFMRNECMNLIELNFLAFFSGNPSASFHPLLPCWPCLNLCHNILSFAMNSGLACVFSVQDLIIAPIAVARLPLDGTYRKCCDRGPMTGKKIKLVCEYINVFPSIKTISAELKILLVWRKWDPIDFSLVIRESSENVFTCLLNPQKGHYHGTDGFI